MKSVRQTPVTNLMSKDLQFNLYLYLDFNTYDFMELRLLTENIWYLPPSTKIKMLFEKGVPLMNEYSWIFLEKNSQTSLLSTPNK